MSIDHQEAIDTVAIVKLRNWIATTKKRTADIGLDTNLIEDGVLDSLEMVNFLLYIEELRGQEIPEALIQPECFTSLRVIHDTFFQS
jgi:acyl carrier protein